jgi:hypothetical protein
MIVSSAVPVDAAFVASIGAVAEQDATQVATEHNRGGNEFGEEGRHCSAVITLSIRIGALRRWF